MKKIFQLLLFLLAGGNLSAQCISINCPGPVSDQCTYLPNNYDFWNDALFQDPLINQDDLAEGVVDIVLNAGTTCGFPLTARYQLFLDLDNNGTQETLVDSDNLPPAGTVLFDNVNGAGASAEFDLRPVGTQDKYRFALEQITNGNTLNARLKWNTDAQPGVFSAAQLPLGTHRIHWYITDGTETQECEYQLTVRDCKKPVIVCINGLIINIMPTGSIQIWSSDLLQYAEDNHTSNPYLKYAMVRSADNTGNFPVDGQGQPIDNLVFDCNEIGEVMVDLWVQDIFGNADYCNTLVIVQDVFDNCDSDPKVCITNQYGQEYVDEFTVHIVSSDPAYNLTDTTDITGCIALPQDLLGADFFVKPVKNDNHLNGVSTFDIVLSSKHMTGLEPLETPYKILAADVDKSKQVDAYDIYIMRQLILGIREEFPYNSSWRFIEGGFVFDDPANPFLLPIPEKAHIQNAFGTMSVQFTAVKTGDLNGTAVTDGFTGEADDRASLTVLIPELSIQAGETSDIPLRLSADKLLEGAQLSLQYDPEKLEMLEIIPGNIQGMNAEAFAQPTAGRLNMVWTDKGYARAWAAAEPFAILRVRALQTTDVTQTFSLDNSRIRAEAYDDTDRHFNLELQAVDGSETPAPAALGLPVPNPTRAGAILPLRLDTPAPVRLTIYDARGRNLYENNFDAGAGSHQLEMPARVFPAPGIYFWHLQAGDLTRSGSIIRQ